LSDETCQRERRPSAVAVAAAPSGRVRMIWPARRTTHERAADGFIESYACWREACDDVRATYGHWGNCRSRERELAFHSYCAALDREEPAACTHADWTERLRVLER
jgi:hypothetical protein